LGLGQQRERERDKKGLCNEKMLIATVALTLLAGCSPEDKKKIGGSGGFEPKSKAVDIDMIEAQNSEDIQILCSSSDFFACEQTTTMDEIADTTYTSSYSSAFSASFGGLTLSAAFNRRYKKQAGNTTAIFESDLLHFRANGNDMLAPNTCVVSTECTNLNCDFLTTENFLKGSPEQFLRDPQAFELRMANQ
jgi:hypothetical protein